MPPDAYSASAGKDNLKKALVINPASQQYDRILKEFRSFFIITASSAIYH